MSDYLHLTTIRYSHLFHIKHHKTWLYSKDQVLIPRTAAIKYVKRIARLVFEIKKEKLFLTDKQLVEAILLDCISRTICKRLPEQRKLLQRVCFEEMDCNLQSIIIDKPEKLSDLRFKLTTHHI